MTGEKGKKGTETIRYMIHQRLKAPVPAESLLDPADAHLDEDAICAFVEGRLEEAESFPVISHLVACAPCRHTTAQLVRLESQFDPEYESTPDESPGRARSLLDHLASHLTSSSLEEDAVFAYQNPEPDPNVEPIGETTEKPEDGN